MDYFLFASFFLKVAIYQYLIPLIIYNNIMDDLDGILADKMNIKSTFGALLDNLCDGIGHSIFVMAVGTHYGGIWPQPA